MGWETQLMDSNFHFLLNKNTGDTSTILGEIHIANNNWIGNRYSIMKNTITASYSTFSSNTLLNKNYSLEGEYGVFVGTPAKLTKGYYRALDTEERILKNKFNIIE